jgi:hypothetical protein
MEIRVIKPFDAARTLADLRIIYADKLQAGRSFAIAAVIVGVGGAVLLVTLSGMNGLVVLLLALAAFGVYIAVGNSRSLRSGVSGLPKIFQQDALVIVTEDRIVHEQQAIRYEVPWTEVTRVAESDAGWLLFYGPRHAISVPKDGLAEDQASQFEAFLSLREAARGR